MVVLEAEWCDVWSVRWLGLDSACMCLRGGHLMRPKSYPLLYSVFFLLFFLQRICIRLYVFSRLFHVFTFLGGMSVPRCRFTIRPSFLSLFTTFLLCFHLLLLLAISIPFLLSMAFHFRCNSHVACFGRV